jgi:Motility quorum-sensing regulator, toxin of MqsA
VACGAGFLILALLRMASYPRSWRALRRTSQIDDHPRADHSVWQDVYLPSTPVGDVYLKLTVIDDVLIVSFKEL